MILRSGNIYCIYFYLFLLYNLKFLDTCSVNGNAEMGTDNIRSHFHGHDHIMVTAMSVPIGVNIKHIFAREGLIFPGGSVFFSWNN